MLRTKLPFFIAYAQKLHKPTFLEYIEFDGNSWIDTGYVPSSNTRVVGKVSFTQWHPTAGANYVFGVFESGANFGFNVGSNRSVMNVPWGTSAGIAFSNDNVFGQVYSFDISKNGAYVDDVLKIENSKLSQEFTSTKSLFVGWSNGTSVQKMIGKIYPIKIYENDILMQDLHPALDPNGEVCMYDTITKQYFYNKGTGSLTPAPIFVEYIESPNRAYINTGLKPSYDYTYKIKYQYTNLSGTYNPIFGVRTSAVTTGDGLFWTGVQYVTNEAYLRFGGNLVTYALDNKALDVIEMTCSPEGIFINGIDTGARYYDGVINTNISEVYLFTLNDAGNPGWSLGETNAKIYSYQVFDENMNLIQDLRPCLQGNTPCMYDMVEGKYYMNVGTGEFKYGKIKFVDYIGSTGTQYIDTGIYAPDITRFVVKGTCQPNGGSNAQLLGTKDSSAATSFFGSRIVSGKQSWYCVVGDSTSIGNPLNLSIIDATIVDDKNQPGTLTDLVEGTTQSFESFVGSTSNFAFLENNLCIFGGSATRVSPNATCYELQIYTADGLVRHFKPCIDGNNVKCMYDLITGKYFYNQGTGEFITDVA